MISKIDINRLEEMTNALRENGYNMNIAIDGHAFAGKTSVTREKANILGIKAISGGHFYRALTSIYLKGQGYTEEDIKNMEKDKATTIKESFLLDEDLLAQILNDENIDLAEEMRKGEILLKAPLINSLVSNISPIKEVRSYVLENEKDVIEGVGDCIMEGRSICTKTIPDSNLKFFVTVSDEEAANRKIAAQNLNIEDKEKIAKSIGLRNKEDEQRENDPLVVAEDATLLDTTYLTTEEAVVSVFNEIYRKTEVLFDEHQIKQAEEQQLAYDDYAMQFTDDGFVIPVNINVNPEQIIGEIGL